MLLTLITLNVLKRRGRLDLFEGTKEYALRGKW
jgi:hypothetical protein